VAGTVGWLDELSLGAFALAALDELSLGAFELAALDDDCPPNPWVLRLKQPASKQGRSRRGGLVMHG
jgi:hypothetical protein